MNMIYHVMALLILLGAVAFLLYRMPSCDLPTVHYQFLTPEECAAIIQEAEKKGFNRSQVVSSQGSITKPSRTSVTVFLDESSPASAIMREKIQALTGLDPATYEAVQVIKYLPGQKYEEHFDACYKCTEKDGDLRRTDTVLVYLNDDFGGGGTYFPLARFRTTPVRGMAVWWKNIDTSKDVILPCSKHTGESVTSGTKYAANIWIRNT